MKPFGPWGLFEKKGCGWSGEGQHLGLGGYTRGEVCSPPAPGAVRGFSLSHSVLGRKKRYSCLKK